MSESDRGLDPAMCDVTLDSNGETSKADLKEGDDETGLWLNELHYHGTKPYTYKPFKGPKLPQAVWTNTTFEEFISRKPKQLTKIKLTPLEPGTKRQVIDLNDIFNSAQESLEMHNRTRNQLRSTLKVGSGQEGQFKRFDADGLQPDDQKLEALRQAPKKRREMFDWTVDLPQRPGLHERTVRLPRDDYDKFKDEKMAATDPDCNPYPLPLPYYAGLMYTLRHRPSALDELPSSFDEVGHRKVPANLHRSEIITRAMWTWLYDSFNFDAADEAINNALATASADHRDLLASWYDLSRELRRDIHNLSALFGSDFDDRVVIEPRTGGQRRLQSSPNNESRMAVVSACRHDNVEDHRTLDWDYWDEVHKHLHICAMSRLEPLQERSKINVLSDIYLRQLAYEYMDNYSDRPGNQAMATTMSALSALSHILGEHVVKGARDRPPRHGEYYTMRHQLCGARSEHFASFKAPSDFQLDRLEKIMCCSLEVDGPYERPANDFCDVDLVSEVHNYNGRTQDLDLNAVAGLCKQLLLQYFPRSLERPEITHEWKISDVKRVRNVCLAFEILTEGSDQQYLTEPSNPEYLAEQTVLCALNSFVRELLEALVQRQDLESQFIRLVLRIIKEVENVYGLLIGLKAQLPHRCLEVIGEQIAKKPNRPAQLFAKFIDRYMKNGRIGQQSMTRTPDDAELRHPLATLDDVSPRDLASLFACFKDKDVFQEFYIRDLLRRLLMQRSASDQLEHDLIAHLEKEAGEELTGRLKRLFSDLESSRGLFKAFSSARRRGRTGTKTELSVVNVLPMSGWDKLKETPIILPSSMQNQLDQFLQWHSKEHSQKTLHWRHSHSYVTMQASFAAGKKEVVMAMPQAIILMAFAEPSQEPITIQDLRRNTGLSHAAFDKAIKSLVAPGQTICIKSGSKSQFVDTDLISINDAFTHKSRKIYIQEIVVPAEDNKLIKDIERDRDAMYQSAAVRILKAKKKIKHEQLLNEIIQFASERHALSSQQDLIKHIKNRIFSFLLDNDYMSRDPSNPSMYIYEA